MTTFHGPEGLHTVGGDRMLDVELTDYPMSSDIASEEFGTGIVVSSGGIAIRFWGPPSTLHRLIKGMDRALEEIVNPRPQDTEIVTGGTRMEVGPR